MKNVYESKKILKENEKDYKKLNEFIANKLLQYGDKKREWKIGYEIFGSFLVGFCKWLNENISRNEIEKIYFLARDGFIIKKAYEILYSDVKTNYLYVSRKSLALPSMKKDESINEIINALILPPMFTIKEFLKTLDIEFNDNKDILRECQIDEKDIFYRNNYKEDKKIKLLVEKLVIQIKEKINEQYNIFIKYLEEQKFNGKVAIVDIGWHNSIQKYFREIINCYDKETEIHGFYVGIYKDAKKFEGKDEAKGFLYEYDVNSDDKYKTFAFVSLFESMFLAHEGTTIRYALDDEKVYPITAEYEYKNCDEMLSVIAEFQDGAIQFINDYKMSEELNDIKLSYDVCSANLVKFGLNPKKEDIRIFGSLSFENFTTNNIVNCNHTIWYYLTHLKELKKDFYKSGWRIVFLKKLFVIPLPYYWIFKKICQIFDGR